MGKYNSLPRLFQETSTCENTEQWGLKNDAAQRNVSLKTPSIKPITVELPRPLNPELFDTVEGKWDTAQWFLWNWSTRSHIASIEAPSHGQRGQKIIQKPLRSRKYSHHSWMSHWEICIEDFEARSLNLHLLVFV